MMVARSSGPISCERRSISDSGIDLPSATRVSTAPSSITSTGRSLTAARVASACAVVSTIARRTWASPRIHAIWSVELVSYTGTGTAPAAQVAKSSRVHSKRVLAMMDTRSPGSMPRATSPRATAVTWSTKDFVVIGIHAPPSSLLSSQNVPCGARSRRAASRPGMDGRAGSIRLGEVAVCTAAPGGCRPLVGPARP